MPRVILAVLLAWGTMPSSAGAWSQSGHYVTARIAWRQLSERQRVYLSTMLRRHPHYATFLAADRPAAVPEVEWVFVRAAYWSDWVRDPRHSSLNAEQSAAIRQEFNKPVWHYVNLPTIAPGEEALFDAAAIRRQILEPALDRAGEPRHILAALPYCLTKLAARETADADKAIYICWLMHLVGDLHQPLHGTSLIASSATFDPPFDPPAGDLGGNRLAIRARAEGRTQRLHAYWDSLLFARQPGFAAVEAVVADLLADRKLRPDELPELKATEFLAWAEESQKLAESHAYRDGGVLIKARSLPPQTRDLGEETAPVLSEAYQKAAAEAARRRFVLAGYRLAAQLAAVVPEP